MEEFKKEHSLLKGKGEENVQWITVNGSHIPLKDGESPKEVIEQRFDGQEKKANQEKTDAVKHLITTLKQIKKIKTKELWNYIKSLKPIKLKINNEEIIAEFDKFTADKNIYGLGNSDIDGFNLKLSNIDKLSSYIEQSNYKYSKTETGKMSKQHKGVKQWHYFVNEIETEKGNFKIAVNVRDKGNNQFIYEVSFKNKKT